MNNGMVHFAIYDTGTGEVYSTGFCGENELPYVAIDAVVSGVYEGKVDTETQYIDVSSSPHSLSEKADFSITQDVETIDISGSPIEYVEFGNIPSRTNVWLDNVNYIDEIDSSPGTISFTAGVAGIYSVTFKHFEYNTIVKTFEATDE